MAELLIADPAMVFVTVSAWAHRSSTSCLLPAIPFFLALQGIVAGVNATCARLGPQEELSASQSLLSSAMGQPAIWLPADAFLLASNGQSSYLVHKVDEFYQQNRKYGELHPLIPLIQAWHRNRPRSGTPNTKDRSRILPETLAMVATEDRRAGHLFMPAAHVDPADQRGQAVLPGFEREDIRGPALPLALYDLGVGPSQSPGRGAPLPLRLFVESVLAVSQQDRRSGKPTDLNISLRELLSRLYPGQRHRH